MKIALSLMGLLLAVPLLASTGKESGKDEGSVAPPIPFTSASGYSVMPAPGWRQDSSGRLHTDVVFFAPSVEGFAANLNVKIRARDADQTLDADRAAMNLSNPRIFKDYALVSQESRPLDGVPAVWTVATFKILQPALMLRLYRIEAIKGDKVYYIDAAEQEDCRDRFDAPIMGMLNSLKWTP